MHPAMHNKDGRWTTLTVLLVAGLIAVIGAEIGALIALVTTSFVK